MVEFLEILFFLALLGLAIFIYLIPAGVAYTRRHKNTLAIAMLNIFAGWLVIGWVIALVWACTKDVKE